MSIESNVVAIEETEARRKQAILRAIGLDRVSMEQREITLAIAKRYDLDLLLKHLVLIDGKPYVTRDALLWIAHRDGHLDGIEVTEPTVRDIPALLAALTSGLRISAPVLITEPDSFAGKHRARIERAERARKAIVPGRVTP